MRKKLIFLGIETSCDETAASIVQENLDGSAKVLSSIVSSQIKEHKKFGGVVPELAARSHIENIDFIISRAGASSVSELSIVGKPVIFIPSPNVAEDHQLKNAMAVVKNEGALLVEEKNIDDLKKRISELNSSSELRNKLSKNIKKTAYTNATIDIVNEIKNLMNR